LEESGEHFQPYHLLAAFVCPRSQLVDVESDEDERENRTDDDEDANGVVAFFAFSGVVELVSFT
jgi:hypothetical protein